MQDVKKVPPSLINLLQEALIHIYWYKMDLRRYLYPILQDCKAFYHVDWSQTKRSAVGQLLLMLQENYVEHEEIILHLIDEVSRFPSYAHLASLDDAQEKVRLAKLFVGDLKRARSDIEELYKDKIIIDEKSQMYRKRLNDAIYQKEEFNKLRDEFRSVFVLENPQQRGYRLETLLNRIFEVHDLHPRRAFKVQGEQVDGAFTFDHVEFILEAKWEKQLTARGDIYIFNGKLEHRLENTLGLFFSMSGFTQDVMYNMASGRRLYILMDGSHLSAILEERVGLIELLRRMRSHAAQTGQAYLPVSEIFKF